MSNMVKVKVFYDGTCEIEEANDNATMQHLYVFEKGKVGEGIICPQEAIDNCKNDLCTKIINTNTCKIIDLKLQNEKIGKLLLTNIN